MTKRRVCPQPGRVLAHRLREAELCFPLGTGEQAVSAERQQRAWPTLRRDGGSARCEE